MTKIKILHVVPGLSSGGVAKVVSEWESQTPSSDYVFDIASLNIEGIFSDYFENKGYEIKYFHPLREVGIIKYCQELFTIIKKSECDIVHSHMGLLSFLVLYIASIIGVKSRVIHAHTNLFHNDPKSGIRGYWVHILKKLCTVSANCHVACTDEAGEYFFSKKVVESNSYFLVKNGLNVDRYKFDGFKRNELRNQMNATGKFVIGNVGRLTDQKNQMFILEIASELRNQGIGFELWLIGEGEDEDKILDFVKAKDLSDNVRLFGVKKDVENYYLCMDVFLMPSKYEGLGIVLIEAQISGLPCVVSNMVPKEVDITGNVEFVELNNKPVVWVDVIKKLRSFERVDCSDKAKYFGYDNYSSTQKLFGIYDDLVR